MNEILNARARLTDDVEALLGDDHEQLPAIRQAISDRFAPLIAPFCEITYTDAPQDYDGFGTHTLETLEIHTRRGPVRKVQTPKENVNWQRNRYGSGCCYALNEEQFQNSKHLMSK